ncbi:MAG: O-antigen ligase domain-containing protein [Actinomycetota bacterium]
MTPLVPIVMYGWIPLVLYLFIRYPAQRAIVASFIIAWLFLPLATYKLPGIPPYTKMSATCYGILLSTVMYDVTRFTSFKLGWLDLPMLIWCCCPFVSSLTNDLGAYDGFSSTFSQVVTWGVPYFLGRVYLNNLTGMRLLAVGTFVGGLVYVPFCLYETRMSINLHKVLYGFNSPASDFLISLRYGGYRPSVFMDSGLMLGVWMMAATLMGIWLWYTGVLKQMWGISVSWLLGVLIVTFILVKATGAYVLLLLSLLILFTAKKFRTAFPLYLLIAGISYYIFLGAIGEFPGKEIVNTMSQVFSKERVESVQFRFENEVILGDKARERILFGWGGFGRNRVFDETGKDISVTDSLWIIAFGTNGIVGLSSLFGSLLLPVFSFCTLRYPPRLWTHPKVAPAAALAVALTMYALDCILNAMTNPIFALISGGLSGIVLQEAKEKKTVPRSLPQTKLRRYH